jgi:hypothetical protein
MKLQLYICTQKDGGSDPFAIVADDDSIYELIAEAIADQSDARVLRSTVDTGVVWAYCYDEDFGEFVIIAEPQKKIYGLDSFEQLRERAA